MFRRTLTSVIATLLLAAPALSECTGQNLLATLPADRRADVDAATDAQPFAQGNLWQTTKDGATVTIVGTYHLDDPRHAETIVKLDARISAARMVLVEAGPDEEQALKSALAKDPSLLFLPDGPSLLQRLPKADWEDLSAAMQARGIPSIMAAKMQPWYVSMMLGIPPCAIAGLTEANGLDKQIMDVAAESGIPIKALEPFDTVFGIFNSMTMDQQIAMIRPSLMMEPQAADMAITLADAYFAQDSRRMWEYSRILSHDFPGYTVAQAEAEFALFEKALATDRNERWIPVIEAAAKDGPIFIAFGALHLSGKKGVLNLLQEAGWTVERLPL